MDISTVEIYPQDSNLEPRVVQTLLLMTIHEEKQAGYITLKEASERFGYAPDYIGQLIRKGKLEGKQVYANVAWMTTEEAMEEYVASQQNPAGEKRATKTESPLRQFSLDRVMDALFTPKMMQCYTWGLRGAAVLLLAALVFVFYFLSISIEHRQSERAQQRLTERMNAIAMYDTPVYQGAIGGHMTYEK